MTTTESTVRAIPAKHPPRKTPLLARIPAWFWQNPILIKDLRARMRSIRSLTGLTVYIGMLSIAIALIYSSIASVTNGREIDTLQTIGRTIFFSLYAIELIVVCITSPAMTAGAISTEKEQQTYDLLRTTLLSERDLVLGKLLAAIAYVILFIVATIPLQALALIFGGLTPAEIILSQIILLLTTLAFGSIGIFYSTFISKTRIATGVAQFTCLVLVLILPVFLYTSLLVFDDQINLSQRSNLFITIFLACIWLLGISSPALTAVFTEIILFEEQSLFFVTQQFPNGNPFYIPSPWLGFVILYPLLIAIMLYFAIRNVKKVEK